MLALGGPVHAFTFLLLVQGIISLSPSAYPGKAEVAEEQGEENSPTPSADEPWVKEVPLRTL